MSPKRSALLSVVLGLVMILTMVSPSSALSSYRVRPGDTLSRIAIRTNSTVAELVRINGLRDPNRIRAGQVLLLPGSDDRDGSSESSDQVGSYKIRVGDTLSEIAVRFGVSSRALMDENGIRNPDRIRSGQTLVIPASAAPSRPARNTYSNLPSTLLGAPERMSLIGIFEYWAEANGIPSDLVMAVAWQESGWQQQVVSSTGAIGIGQIMPATGEWIARDLIGRPNLDPMISEDNIRMTARYLDWLLGYFDTEEEAIAAYYQGQGSISRGFLYDDTIAYVEDVKALRSAFQAS